MISPVILDMSKRTAECSS